jgi:hypothetical protein
MVMNHITYLNSGQMVQDLFLEHNKWGGKGFKPSHLRKWLVGLGSL